MLGIDFAGNPIDHFPASRFKPSATFHGSPLVRLTEPLRTIQDVFLVNTRQAMFPNACLANLSRVHPATKVGVACTTCAQDNYQ